MSSLLPKPAIDGGLLLEPSEVDSAQQFVVRQLNSIDGNAFKAIRLEALHDKDAQYFGASYEEEKQLSEQQWQERCTPANDRTIFGMFDHKHLIGVMAASKWTGDQSEQTALWGSVYLKSQYRSLGLAADLYKARAEWTKRNKYKTAVFFIREGNKRSTEIHEKQGAELMYIKPMRWANGDIAPARWYKKQLQL